MFGAGWVAFAAGAPADAQREKQFCRFGICDLDSVLAKQTPPQRDTLLEAVRRCYAQALALGPRIPPILLQAADFYFTDGDRAKALGLVAQALSLTTIYDVAASDWLAGTKLPTAEVLAQGLPYDAVVYRKYLRHRLEARDLDGSTQLWNAALAWVAYRGARSGGFMQSNFIYNGDFEEEFARLPFDWNLQKTDGVAVERDAAVKHSGAYSLRIRLEGKQNLTSVPVSQAAAVTPGSYRFEAWVKTQELSTDQGVILRLEGTNGRLDARTEPLLGTSAWQPLRLSVCVPADAKLVAFSMSRQPSLKFDNLIRGTIWLDSVSLTKLNASCGG